MLLFRVAILATVCVLASAPTTEEIMTVHPDGTPVHPAELKAFLMQWDGDLVAAYGSEVKDAVFGNDLEAFTAIMQIHNYDKMFDSDGSVKDIDRWRQNVREDEKYYGLLQDAAPEFLQMIVDRSVSDEDVQEMLRNQHRAQAEAQAAEQRLHRMKGEL